MSFEKIIVSGLPENTFTGFFGGGRTGYLLQITIGKEYVHLNKAQVTEFVLALEKEWGITDEARIEELLTKKFTEAGQSLVTSLVNSILGRSDMPPVEIPMPSQKGGRKRRSEKGVL
jgi:hypothetical protein